MGWAQTEWCRPAAELWLWPRPRLPPQLVLEVWIPCEEQLAVCRSRSSVWIPGEEQLAVCWSRSSGWPDFGQGRYSRLSRLLPLPEVRSIPVRRDSCSPSGDIVIADWWHSRYC